MQTPSDAELQRLAAQAREIPVLGQPQVVAIFPFKRLHEDAILPTKAHPSDAGFDLSSVEEVTLPPGGRALIPTGWAMALPVGSVGLVCPRSGLAAKHGITVTNAPGVIDAGYRGELKVVLQNTDTENEFVVEKGMRIAQVVVSVCAGNVPMEVDDLPPAPDRGEAGFGSSGV